MSADSEYRTAEYAHHLNNNCGVVVRSSVFPLEFRERKDGGSFACELGMLLFIIFSQLFNSMFRKKCRHFLLTYFGTKQYRFQANKRAIRKGLRSLVCITVIYEDEDHNRKENKSYDIMSNTFRDSDRALHSRLSISL